MSFQCTLVVFIGKIKQRINFIINFQLKITYNIRNFQSLRNRPGGMYWIWFSLKSIICIRSKRLNISKVKLCPRWFPLRILHKSKSKAQCFIKFDLKDFDIARATNNWINNENHKRQYQAPLGQPNRIKEWWTLWVNVFQMKINVFVPNVVDVVAQYCEFAFQLAFTKTKTTVSYWQRLNRWKIKNKNK